MTLLLHYRLNDSLTGYLTKKNFRLGAAALKDEDFSATRIAGGK